MKFAKGIILILMDLISSILISLSILVLILGIKNPFRVWAAEAQVGE